MRSGLESAHPSTPRTASGALLLPSFHSPALWRAVLKRRHDLRGGALGRAAGARGRGPAAGGGRSGRGHPPLGNVFRRPSPGREKQAMVKFLLILLLGLGLALAPVPAAGAAPPVRPPTTPPGM